MEKIIVINGVETNYIITSEGRVFNRSTGKELKGTIQRNEYHTVQLIVQGKPKSLMIHRLVAEAFIENPNNYTIVDHIDRNKLNNNINNLRWADSKTNAQNVNNFSAKTKGKQIDLTKDFTLSEDWKIIDNETPQYLINQKGEIINIKTGRYVIGSTRNGYKRVTINKKTRSIHRIVWEIFNGEIPKDMVIDHIDGNRSNNDLNNLRLVTQSENMINAQKNGHKGQKPVVQYSLTGEKIAEYESIQKAADQMGVTHAAIRSAINRNGSCKNYKWYYI